MIALWIIYGLIGAIELLLVINFRLGSRTLQLADDEKLPPVSVLVCARNEVQNLEDCLKSILNSEYPNEFEILVGDDNSEDGTARIIENYEDLYTEVRGIGIAHEKDGLIAKANVLNQLIDEANYEQQVIVDADMIVEKLWLKYMVSALCSGNDMVSGYTQILRSTWLTHIQFFDWQIVLHSMKSMADLIRPLSILGNNMAFNKQAYDKVGGFRALGPTDVEDLGLLQRFQRQGLQTFQMVVADGYACTKPQLTFNELLTQRCRWMNGVFTHHWILTIPALFARLWLIVALAVLSFEPILAISITSYAFVVNHFKFGQMNLRSKAPKVKFYLIEPLVISLLDTFALFRLLLVGKVSWKGRKH